jgi:hypothetical protein
MGKIIVTDHVDPSALAAKATPPLAYGAATLAGLSIEQWISVLTVVYLVFAIITLIFPGWRVALVSWWRKWRG